MITGDRPRNAKRVLITGLSTYWGGRLAQALESFPEIEAIIGVDSSEPTRELERTDHVSDPVDGRLGEDAGALVGDLGVADERLGLPAGGELPVAVRDG